MNRKNDPSSITVVLNDRSFEYDVYTLVIAFYQGIPVQVEDPVLGAKSSDGPDGQAGADQNGPDGQAGAGRNNPDGSTEIDEKKLLISVHIDKKRTDIKAGKLESSREAPSQDRMDVKNALKGCLYELLSRLTGRFLPWGNLTGIRPVKLATGFLLKEEQAPAESLSLREEQTPAGSPSGREEQARGESFTAREDLVRRTAADMQKAYYVSDAKADLAARIALREQKILRQIHPETGYSLYIGIPFCPSICLYCSFSSGTIGVWQKEADRYVDTLIKEIRACGRAAERPCFPGRKLTTVYIGGGTPTTLSAAQLERLFSALEENFDMDSVLEFTVEAGRPDTISEDKLRVMKRHRVSRISINPQTMNQKTLDLIGRKHTVSETVNAFRMARDLGFDNINMDLIVGLPGEGLPEVDATMNALEKLGPDDITVHALALKRAARLALRMDEYEAISFQASDAIMERTQETCRALGMTPYYLYRQKNMAGNFENVGCAKEGKAGLYNILIMEEVQSILALGASGSTKVILPGGRIERIENVKDVRSYLDRIDEMIARKDMIR